MPVAPDVLLITDSVAALIWRVDLPADGAKPTARVWIEHESMANDPKGTMPDQPGVNGVRFVSKTSYLYVHRHIADALHADPHPTLGRTTPRASPRSWREA